MECMNEYIAFRTGASYTHDPSGSKGFQTCIHTTHIYINTFKMLFHVILYVSIVHSSREFWSDVSHTYVKETHIKLDSTVHHVVMINAFCDSQRIHALNYRLDPRERVLVYYWWAYTHLYEILRYRLMRVIYGNEL